MPVGDGAAVGLGGRAGAVEGIVVATTEGVALNAAEGVAVAAAGGVAVATARGVAVDWADGWMDAPWHAARSNKTAAAINPKARLGNLINRC